VIQPTEQGHLRAWSVVLGSSEYLSIFGREEVLSFLTLNFLPLCPFLRVILPPERSFLLTIYILTYKPQLGTCELKLSIPSLAAQQHSITE
jgi:hypothetical protein